jgi:hypothetical protein
MAFDKTPTTWLPGYALTSSQAIFNTATHAPTVTLPQLTDTEANASTGDIRAVAFAMIEALFQGWVSQVGSEPNKMTISRVITPGSTTLTYQYQLRFVITPPAGASTVAAE